MTEKNVDIFSQQLKAMHGRINELYQNANTGPMVSSELLLPTAFKELGCASEELHIAAEELLAQNEQLIGTRFLLETERQRYQELFDFAPEPYIVTNNLGVIEEVNRAAVNMMQVSTQYLVGKPLAVFVPESDRQNFRHQLNQLERQDKLPEWLTRLCPRHGEPLDCVLKTTTVRDRDGKVAHLMISIRDISQHRQALRLLAPVDLDYDLSEHGSKQSFSKGENIPLNHQSIWLVLEGLVKLTTIAENAEELIVGLAGPQMPFGACFTSLSTYQATALSKDVQVVCISMQTISASANLAQALLPKITLRLQQTESFLSITGQRRIQDRLYYLLLLLKQLIGQPTAGGTRLSIRLTHNDLASTCGTTRVTMTRMLRRLQQQGTIAFDKKFHIIILNEALETA